MTLTELANRYGTDKGTATGASHGYTEAYEALLAPRREQVRSVLELGVYQGASLLMWRDYFPNAVIHGLDHVQEMPVALWEALRALPRLCLHLGDASNHEDLSIVGGCGYPFDLIVDDASHQPADYLRALATLRKYAGWRSLHIVEDVQVGDVPHFDGYTYDVIPSRYPGRCAVVIR